MDEVRIKAMLDELSLHANTSRGRAADLAGELAVANQRIQALTEQVEKQAKEFEELRPIITK